VGVVCACCEEPRTPAHLSEEDPTEAGRIRRLWASVGLAAIADADDDPTGPAGRYLASRDFLDVCDLAGLDGAAAQQRVARMAQARLDAARAADELPAPRRKTKEAKR
jgi:hypothetical protein